ncbi:MAG TPA: beta-eliminating lyase-related protein [Steroidobacteraceae bacterium]
MDAVEPGWQFASDNTAGICPEAWDALAAANAGHAPSYGEDEWTRRAADLIRALFECPAAQVFFVLNGTAANSLALAALCRSYHGIICHEQSHVQTDECGAPEFFSHGAKLLTVAGGDAKVSPAAVAHVLEHGHELHSSKPRAVSLSQSTEWGTVYDAAQMAALGRFTRAHDLALHVDGARFANALAALGARGVGAADVTWRAGVDALSLGGTKGGLNTSEAVIFFNPDLAQEFDYRCKQGGQLASKMRFQTSQWVGVLESGAWLRHAAHANAAAARLGAALRALPGVRLLREVEVNAVFVDLEAGTAEAMARAGWYFHRMPGTGYRLMCSWATTDADIERFVADLAPLQRQ